MDIYLRMICKFSLRKYRYRYIGMGMFKYHVLKFIKLNENYVTRYYIEAF